MRQGSMLRIAPCVPNLSYRWNVNSTDIICAKDIEHIFAQRHRKHLEGIIKKTQKHHRLYLICQRKPDLPCNTGAFNSQGLAQCLSTAFFIFKVILIVFLFWFLCYN
jgi:hypothetical protein